MKILISKGRKDVRSREDNRNRMESNIKIASRIIIFFNKMRYVIRYVGFRDVIISIHVKKKEKYVEDLIYYCWIVEEKY